jgi:hypothetical protein
VSRAEWLVSAWLLGHLLVIGLTVVPDPSQYDPPSLVRSLDDPLSAWLAPALDEAAAGVSLLTRGFWRMTDGVRSATAGYVRTAGSLPSWRMFWSPSSSDRYLRVRFHGRSTSTPADGWTATALVMPAYPAGQVRGLYAHRLNSHDKAIRSAINLHFGNGGAERRGPSAGSRDVPETLVPIVRYFSRRFQEEQLASDQELTWVELWFGTSPNPPRGFGEDLADLAARQRVLERYYRAPFERVPGQAYSRAGATEMEADITWTVVSAAQP